MRKKLQIDEGYERFEPSYEKIVDRERDYTIGGIIKGLISYIQTCPPKERDYHTFVLGVYQEEQERQLMREVDYVYKTGRR